MLLRTYVLQFILCFSGVLQNLAQGKMIKEHELMKAHFKVCLNVIRYMLFIYFAIVYASIT